jgi:(4S)-4-hydroxy-5-phosphonooxypentane-2,3-dione isomerase
LEANVYAIFVSVKIKPDKLDQFLSVIEDDSICSVRDEPGCVRFDVLQDTSDPLQYYFYEVYVDEAGFEAHTKTPHLARWREAAKECVEEQKPTIRTTTVFPRNYA